MYLRRVLGVIAIAGYCAASFATDSRVLTMGRSDNFFMDETSIYRNPANVNVYPNMLMGDLGRYVVDPAFDDTSRYAGLSRYNRDPVKPYFGSIISYSLNQTAEAGDQYPMLSLAAVINRYDPMLGYIDPNSPNFAGKSTYDMADPVGKIDVIAGYALKNGGMIGVGTYLAFQKVTEQSVVTHESSLYKGNIGINWPLSKTMDIEASFGGAKLTGIGIEPDSVAGPNKKVIVADHDLAVKADLRLFSALTVLNGDFVPHLGFEMRNLGGDKEQIIDVNGGIGLNINIDRGFFWAAIEGIYQSSTLQNEDQPLTEDLGGRVNFGIERNIVWDWLVWRAGGTKKILYQQRGENSGNWIQNPESDASDDDLLSFGIGLNIENRLKVDGVVAEDIFYTFTNLFSGNQHHLMTRISATYSF